MVNDQFFDEGFNEAVILAGDKARIETLQAGIPICYKDSVHEVDVMEYPDGRKFEIRFIPGAPRDRNYEVVREHVETAA